MQTTPVTSSTYNGEAVVDLDAIVHNVGVLREHAGSSQVMAVVKADGYGHGAIAVSEAAISAGADWLAVALVEEGAVLRKAGKDVHLVGNKAESKAASPGLMEAYSLGFNMITCHYTLKAAMDGMLAVDDVEAGERGDEIADERDQANDRVGAELDAEQRELAVQTLLQLFQLCHAIAFVRHQTTTSHASALVLRTSNTTLPLRKGS